MKILMPIPETDFDPSESSIPWKILTENGFEISFATPNGKPGKADFRMLTGEGLGIWKKLLMAKNDAVECYREMEKSREFQNPISYKSISTQEFDGLILPGGHAQGMKEYLESEILQKIVSEFFLDKRPVGAICHGVVLVARSNNQQTKKSVLHGYQTTALLKAQERAAYLLTGLWLGNYYRTYPVYVEDEIRSVLAEAKDFHSGNSGLFRDSKTNLNHGFTVVDRNYISARWPGDAYTFSYGFMKLMNGGKK